MQVLILAGSILIAAVLICLQVERHRQALLAVDRTLTNTALAKVNLELAQSGGSMGFARLSERTTEAPDDGQPEEKV